MLDIMASFLYNIFTPHCSLNTLRPRQNGRHFPDDIYKCIFLNENVWISIKISLQFVPMGPINNIPALVQIMAWRRSGDKPLSEPMMVRLLTHICATQPQWVKSAWYEVSFESIFWESNVSASFCLLQLHCCIIMCSISSSTPSAA